MTLALGQMARLLPTKKLGARSAADIWNQARSSRGGEPLAALTQVSTAVGDAPHATDRKRPRRHATASVEARRPPVSRPTPQPAATDALGRIVQSVDAAAPALLIDFP